MERTTFERLAATLADIAAQEGGSVSLDKKGRLVYTSRLRGRIFYGQESTGGQIRIVRE